VREVTNYQRAYGLFLGDGFVPISLLPSRFPRRHYDLAVMAQPIFNKLVDRISRDYDFLVESLKNVNDPFTVKIMEVMVKATEHGICQPISMGIHRSDYMVNSFNDRLIQVEINTISAAYCCFGSIVTKLYKYILKRYDILDYNHFNLVQNDSQIRVPLGIAKAFEIYGKKDAKVLYVVQGGERNVTDQKLIEYELFQTHNIKSDRKTLAEIGEKGVIIDNCLWIDDCEVAVVYFRAGYTPNDYKGELEWTARYKIEISRAIKCPTAAYQLVGTKKMQQIFSDPNILKKYLDSPLEVEIIQSCFTKLYSLDPEVAQEIIPKVLENPNNYVMKPQREGGGNLLTNETMVKALTTFSPEDLSSYILMDRIFPEPQLSYLHRNGKIEIENAISELGIFGVYIGDENNTYYNDVAGSLLRTKPSNKEDGGVSAGVAVLDSVYLI